MCTYVTIKRPQILLHKWNTKIKGMALVYTLNFVIDFFVFFQMFHKKGERSKRDHPSIIPIDPPMLPKRT